MTQDGSRAAPGPDDVRRVPAGAPGQGQGWQEYYHVNHPYGPPPPQPPPQPEESPATQASGSEGRFAENRAAWISAWAAIVVALITTLGAFLSQILNTDDPSGGSGPSAASAPAQTPHGGVTSTPSSPPVASPPPSASTPAMSQPASASATASVPPGGAEVWHGVLLVGAYGKDVDPGQSGTAAGDGLDMYVGDLGDGLMAGSENGAEISTWQGTGLPDYAGCATSVDAGSSDFQPLAQGTVLCVRTNGGHIARLQMTKLPGDSLDGSATFDAVIWNAG